MTEADTDEADLKFETNYGYFFDQFSEQIICENFCQRFLSVP